MYKILYFGLFLIGSLLMSALTFHVNLLSNAVAQGYDKYGDSYYSTYQNNDKKYECQKGPFKGFFVSSVEFCDVEDDKKMKSQQEPQTSSLTVDKEVFGCDIINQDDEGTMNCKNLSNNSPLWINCEDPPMSIEGFCQNLPENLFDFRVLGPQNNLIDEFVGPEKGRTFDNLQPGTYTIEEIKHETFINQLGPSQGAEDLCKERGFTDGGRLDNQNADLRYFICFEYEDEQGNDCNTITLAAGEQRTCNVKNYIQDIDRIQIAEGDISIVD